MTGFVSESRRPLRATIELTLVYLVMLAVCAAFWVGGVYLIFRYAG